MISNNEKIDIFTIIKVVIFFVLRFSNTGLVRFENVKKEKKRIIRDQQVTLIAFPQMSLKVNAEFAQ